MKAKPYLLLVFLLVLPHQNPGVADVGSLVLAAVDSVAIAMQALHIG